MYEIVLYCITLEIYTDKETGFFEWIISNEGGIRLKLKNQKLLPFLLLAVIAVLALVVLLLHMKGSGVKNEKLKVTVLKTGKSDAIVLESAGKAMMIDTGEVDDAEKIVEFLKAENITSLDAVVITHYDKDHVGAAGLIVENFNVDRVLVPDYEGTRTEYFDFMNAMKAAMIVPQRVSETMEFTFGETTVLIDPPVDYDVNTISDVEDDYDNTLSLMTTVTCGEKRFLFTGDADRRRIKEWLSNGTVQHVDFLKVPHLGLFNAALDQLLEATTPDCAAITCSAKNPADDSTLEVLKKYGVDVYQTRNGQITVTTDGSKLNLKLN